MYIYVHIMELHTSLKIPKSENIGKPNKKYDSDIAFLANYCKEWNQNSQTGWIKEERRILKVFMYLPETS